MKHFSAFDFSVRYITQRPEATVVQGLFDVLRSRLAASETSNYLGPKNRRDLEIRIMELRPLKLEDDEYNSINTDLFPMDEFRSP